MRQFRWQLGAVIVGAMAAASCTTTKPAPAAAPAVAAAPGAQNCVRLTSIRESRVISDNVIDFIMNDGTTYRNTLPGQCPGLGMSRAFGYATSLNDLCSVNTITVIMQGGGPVKGATCMLGQFVPYTPPAKASPAK